VIYVLIEYMNICRGSNERGRWFQNDLGLQDVRQIIS